jgi:hypothetical protein
MSDLVHITPEVIPPTRQSHEIMTSCPVNYATQVIEHRQMPGGMDAARGTDIHDVSAKYQNHCALKEVKMDLEAFDRLAKGAGAEASRILSGIRDNWQIDYAHLLVTECKMALDGQFRPTHVQEALRSVCSDSGEPAEYEGTPDAIYVYRDEKRVYIPDLKSHARAFDPDDTLQAKMYSIFCFQHFDWAETITFELIFCRYKNLRRSVTFTRKDIPMLVEAVKSQRSRQIAIHVDYAAGNALQAISGKQCRYCTRSTDLTCPIASMNDYIKVKPEDGLRYILWYGDFAAKMKRLLAEYVDATGRDIILRDYNGKIVKYGPVPSESSLYPIFVRKDKSILRDPHGDPIMPIIGEILEWIKEEPLDADWVPKLLISSTELNKPLGANKRAILDQRIQDLAIKVSKPQLKITYPKELDEGDYEEKTEE